MNEKGVIQEVKLLLRTLREIRDREKYWKDGYEKSSKKGVLGFVKDLEALECFLEYYEKIDEKRKGILSDVFLDDNYLVEDINNIMKIVNSNKGYPATPYLEIDENKLRRGDTDFTDSISFVISTFLDFRSYLEKRKKIRGIDLSSITQVILDSVATLIGYKKRTPLGRGWPGGPEMGEPQLYFTYTSVVALAAALEEKDTILNKELASNIETLLKDSQKWIEHLSQQNGKGGWVPIEECQYNENKHFIYSTYALMALHTIWDTIGSVNKEIIKNGTEYIVKKWDEDKKLFDKSTEYIHLEKTGDYTGKFTDRCTLPNSIWCLSKAYLRDIGNKETLEKIISQQLEMLRGTFVSLTGDRWVDKGIDELDLVLPSGEIYYTLRTIECLCEYYLNVEKVIPSLSEEEMIQAQKLYLKLKEIFLPQNLTEKVSNLETKLNKIEGELDEIKPQKGILSKEAMDAIIDTATTKKIESAVKVICATLSSEKGKEVEIIKKIKEGR